MLILCSKCIILVWFSLIHYSHTQQQFNTWIFFYANITLHTNSDLKISNSFKHRSFNETDNFHFWQMEFCATIHQLLEAYWSCKYNPKVWHLFCLLLFLLVLTADSCQIIDFRRTSSVKEILSSLQKPVMATFFFS